ncbi:SGNH/GDSL hydrolase family protein [Cognatiyoonia sp. IB215446]|uniref:SGNH/GDSL hydrolase family protein n=1 Tax=Cognatiyoonia sp. IB215446 TaxID=3097355 RepID=UPI002A184F00|nr:SGNH/GDSL hydrolase family protein [Cognatiyoonia sp. IB215446]MDX8347243.1 SGNH/GDSL hydrolase family protein [Cognatiyoonia sp. IB215446]
MILDAAARTVLMPVLLLQAVYLRMTVLRLPEPDGAREGKVGQGPPLRLTILGDSSAAGVGVADQQDALLGQVNHRLAPHFTTDYRLIAATGSRTGDVLGWLQDMQALDADVAVIALGVNDVTKGVSLRRWLRQQSALLDRLVHDFGVKYVVVSGLPPMHDFPLLPQPLRWVLGRQAARFDKALHEMVAERRDATSITIDMRLNRENMSEDGFHPGPVVYSAWADAVAAQILDHAALLDGTDRNA